MDQFGLGSGSAEGPIDFRTDAADDVGELLRRANLVRTYTVSKAAPQEDNVVGGAERGVREIKEAICVVRLELRKHGLDVTGVGCQVLLCHAQLAWEGCQHWPQWL